jgi:hypothetical protein
VTVARIETTNVFFHKNAKIAYISTSFDNILLLKEDQLCDYGGCPSNATRVVHPSFLVTAIGTDTFRYCRKHCATAKSIIVRPIAREHPAGESCEFCLKLSPLTEEDFETEEQEVLWSDLV